MSRRNDLTVYHRVRTASRHICRVVDGMLVEHRACRDDISLVEQLLPS